MTIATEYQHAHRVIGSAISTLLPDTNDSGEWPSLRTVVITGLETPWQHFAIDAYDPVAKHDWATVRGLKDAYGVDTIHAFKVDLYPLTVRGAVADWAWDLLDHGIPLQDVLDRLRDLDSEQADAILQFAVYGKVVLG